MIKAAACPALFVGLTNLPLVRVGLGGTCSFAFRNPL
jgi:hypothetical protein